MTENESYVTVEQADEYIAKHYSSSNSFRVKWDGLTKDDKETYLISSTQAIDSLKFIGRKYNFQQLHQFPRITVQSRFLTGWFGQPNQYYDDTYYGDASGMPEGLALARQACIENALEHAYMENEIIFSTVNGIRGITSKRIGPIAETYNNLQRESRSAKQGIYSQKVFSILNPWLSSSFLSF